MTEQQLYFLSDENDIYGGRFRNDVEFWSSKIEVLGKSGNRAKCFSTMMASCGIFLYDHPEAMKKYPNGFYSENTIFVPINMYDTMMQLEPLAVKTNNINSYWNLTGLVLINFLTNMIEKKYEIVFSQEEKEKILLSATENSFAQKQLIIGNRQIDSEIEISDKELDTIMTTSFEQQIHYLSKIETKDIIQFVKEVFNNKQPQFVSNADIAVFARDNELYTEETFEKQNQDTSFIDYALLKNPDMYEKNHPFNILMGKVKIPAKTIDLLDMDKAKYRDMINNLSFGDAYIIFNAFENLTYNIFKNSKTEDDILRNITGIWSNFALETSDTHFEVLINILYDNFIQKYPNQHEENIWEDMGFKIAKSINENEKTTNTKRRLIIDGLSRQSEIYATLRTIIYPQKSKKLSI